MSQTPQGSAVGPFSHDSALARIRAALVLPTPRAPVNKKAWWTRFWAMAFESVRDTCSCPTSSEKRWGRYFRARTRYDTRGAYHCVRNPERVPHLPRCARPASRPELTHCVRNPERVPHLPRCARPASRPELTHCVRNPERVRSGTAELALLVEQCGVLRKLVEMRL